MLLQYGFWLMLATLGIGSECFFGLKVAPLVCWPRRATVRSACLMWLWVYVGTQGKGSKCHLEGVLNFMLATQCHSSNCHLIVPCELWWPRRENVRRAPFKAAAICVGHAGPPFEAPLKCRLGLRIRLRLRRGLELRLELRLRLRLRLGLSLRLRLRLMLRLRLGLKAWA